jgi:hypothetical protein
MKRNIISASIIIILGLFFTNQVFAQATIKTIDQVINKPLDVVSGTKTFDVTINKKTIDDTSAEFDGFATRRKDGIVAFIFGANDSQTISLNPDNRPNDKGTLDNIGFFADNIGIPINGQGNFTVPFKIIGLQKATTYYFQIKDLINNTVYEKIAFTTTGTAPNNGQIPPLSTTDQKKRYPRNRT